MYSKNLSNELGSLTKTIVLCGIETHVCIYATALELLEKGYIVHVVADATSSRTNSDRYLNCFYRNMY